MGDPHELFCNPRAMRKSKGFSGRSSHTGEFSACCHHDALILRAFKRCKRLADLVQASVEMSRIRSIGNLVLMLSHAFKF